MKKCHIDDPFLHRVTCTPLVGVWASSFLTYSHTHTITPGLVRQLAGEQKAACGGDDLERQDVDSGRRRHGSGQATRLLMAHKVMFVVLGGVGVCVCVCVCLLDGEQPKRVRGAPSQLIRCVRCPRRGLGPPSHVFQNWQTGLITPRAWPRMKRQMFAAAVPYGAVISPFFFFCREEQKADNKYIII